MGVGFDSVTLSEVDGRNAFVIKSSESHILIGSHGAHIAALNHLIKRIAVKHSEPLDAKLDFYVDVNDYHSKLTEEVKNRATILAGRARSFKTRIEMDPMSSYERMIVHTLFQDSPDIKTESVGVGDSRHVVLMYVEPPSNEKEGF